MPRTDLQTLNAWPRWNQTILDTRESTWGRKQNSMPLEYGGKALLKYVQLERKLFHEIPWKQCPLWGWAIAVSASRVSHWCFGTLNIQKRDCLGQVGNIGKVDFAASSASGTWMRSSSQVFCLRLEFLLAKGFGEEALLQRFPAQELGKKLSKWRQLALLWKLGVGNIGLMGSKRWTLWCSNPLEVFCLDAGVYFGRADLPEEKDQIGKVTRTGMPKSHWVSGKLKGFSFWNGRQLFLSYTVTERGYGRVLKFVGFRPKVDAGVSFVFERQCQVLRHLLI